MDIIDLRSLFTVLAFVSFVGIVWWAWSSGREEAFSEAARIPMDDDDRPAAARGGSKTEE
ncbi:MAG: CcoQ/FixQ family Cbb3-type cytochrome c oxidase assembly chaperone [Rhodocyclaceae bacterium]|nr:CcoQ/FixQ family Cbb3-type cytochrome c oxidase assembly chaperone [Rhodocyclaceae bacterium]